MVEINPQFLGHKTLEFNKKPAFHAFQRFFGVFRVEEFDWRDKRLLVSRAVLALGLMDEKGEGLSPRGLKTLIHKICIFYGFPMIFQRILRS